MASAGIPQDHKVAKPNASHHTEPHTNNKMHKIKTEHPPLPSIQEHQIQNHSPEKLRVHSNSSNNSSNKLPINNNKRYRSPDKQLLRNHSPEKLHIRKQASDSLHMQRHGSPENLYVRNHGSDKLRLPNNSVNHQQRSNDLASKIHVIRKTADTSPLPLPKVVTINNTQRQGTPLSNNAPKFRVVSQTEIHNNNNSPSIQVIFYRLWLIFVFDTYSSNHFLIERFFKF